MNKGIKLLVTTNILVIVLMFVLAADIYDKPTADWWSGSATHDVAWEWAKTIDGMVMGRIGTGKIWYVDSNVSNEGDGGSWTDAKDTLDEAVNACYADGGTNRGDFILVAQGHTETLGAAADEVDLDVAGITVIGCGNGSLRPLFDYTGDVTGAFAVGAANIAIENCVFNANITDVNEAIEVESAGDNCTIRNCEFTITANGTDEFADCILVADTANFLTVENCLFRMGGGAANHGIYLDADVLNCTIRNNIFHGDYAVACIKGDEANDYTLILDNILINGDLIGDGSLNDQPVIELADNDCSFVSGNKCATNVATNHLAMTVADDGVFIENFTTDDDGDEFEGTSRSGTAAVTASADG